MLLIPAATVASYAIGWAIAQPVLVPFLNAAFAWWRMASELRQGRTRQAIAVMLVWALTLGVVSTLMAASGWSRRHDGGELFLRASYRDDMIHWVRTGIGPESTPAVFLPRHATHTVAFAAASVVTGGVLSMPMGAALMNQMGEYVGAMAATSAHPVASALLGWHPWAVIRITGFVIIGVVFSGVLLSRVWRVPYSLSAERRWLALGAALLVVDALLKWALAPTWAVLLKGLAGW